MHTRRKPLQLLRKPEGRKKRTKPKPRPHKRHWKEKGREERVGREMRARRAMTSSPGSRSLVT